MAGNRLIIATGLLAALLPPGAQSDTDDDRPAVETITVTATRNPIESFDYPGMVTVVGPDKLATLQPSSPGDTLRFVPNVEFTGGPRRTGETPAIRGFAGDDVVVMVDGARQNFGSGHDGRFFLDPSLLRRVELLRGPASALYGSGGTGGVLEFRTVGPADYLTGGRRFGATFRGGYQDVNDESIASLTGYALPMNGAELLASVTKRDSGSIDLSDGTELRHTDDDIRSVFAKAAYAFGAHHRLETSFRRFDNTAEEPNNGQGAGGTDLVEKDLLSEDIRIAYGYHDPENPLLDLDVIAYRTRNQADELRLDDLGIGPAGELLERDVETIGLRLDNRSRFTLSDAIDARLTYGIEFYSDEQDGAAGSGERAGVPDAEADFLGVFLQAELSIDRPLGVLPGTLFLLPGVRYDDYETSNELGSGNQESEWSPRIGASYAPVDWGLVFINAAKAFRAPSMDELYTSGVHFVIPIAPGVDIINRFVANPDLLPQTTRTLEYGFGLDFADLFRNGDALRLKLARFHVRGENFIDLAVMQPAPFVECFPFFPAGACDGTTRSANVADAKLSGTEAEASYENGRFSLNVAYGRIDGKDEATGDRLGALAPDKLTAIAALKLPEIDALVGWRVLAAARFDRVNSPAEIRAGYLVNDFFLAWQPDSGTLEGFRLDFGVDNAFDKKHELVFNDVAEPGRNFKALLSYSMSW